MPQKSSDSIKVYARLRHANNSIDDNETDHYSINQKDSSLTIIQPKHKTHLKFEFNRIFKCGTSQQHVFDDCGKSLVDQAIKGYNCSIIAYGQTGSGKTYSMLGLPSSSSTNTENGLIYRCMNELFSNLRLKDKEKQQLSLIKVSFIEIYQDKMRDLLISTRINSKQKRKTAFGKSVLNDENKEFEANNQLKIKKRYKDKKPLESYVSNLTEEYVTSIKDIEILIGIAKARRATCATLANSYSSRSHWIMIVTIEQKTYNSCTTISKLNFVDLAGSEKVKLSGVTGNSLQEAKTINKSLHNLRLCISALASKQQYCPYRDSTLTHLLQDSLGGNTKTSLLITLNMDKNMSDETISSCRFGSQAQNVINIPKINKRASRKELEIMITKLQKQLNQVYNGNIDESINISLSTELNNAKKRMIQLKKCIVNYENMITNMKCKKREDNENMENMSKLCDELKKEREIMGNSVKSLSDQLDKMRKHNLQLKEKNFKLKKNNDTLNKQMMNANNHIYDLQNKINRNEKIYVEVTNQNANLSQQFEQLKQAQDNKFQVLLNEISIINRDKGPDIIHLETRAKSQIEDKDEDENKLPTELDIENNVLEYSIAPQPVISKTQLLEAYFTNIPDESVMNQSSKPIELKKNVTVISSNKNKKKINSKPIRLLIKVMRLINAKPKYKRSSSFDDCWIQNVSRHRKLSDDIMNMNQGYTSYATAGYAVSQQ